MDKAILGIKYRSLVVTPVLTKVFKESLLKKIDFFFKSSFECTKKLQKGFFDEFYKFQNND